jgi:hypothetical protein
MTRKKTTKKKTAARKRGGLGANPLDSMVPVQAASKASRRGLAPAGTTPRREAPPKIKNTEKSRYTLHLPVELMERAKNAAYWTPGLTLGGLAEAGIRANLERIEKKHGPFKARESELVGGRPLGS